MYINCKTYFSFRYGTIATEELVSSAAAQGIQALALTNINNTCDAWDFVQSCHKHGIKPVVGAEIRNGDDLLYILLAANNKGIQWINYYISTHLIAKEKFPEHAGPACFFWDPGDGFVVYPYGKKNLPDLLANEFSGIRPHEVNKLFAADLSGFTRKLVILQSVTYQDRKHFDLHRLLRCIDKNVLGTKLPASGLAGPGEYFVSEMKLIEQYSKYPFLITNTYRLMDACNISIEFGTDKNKRNFSAARKDDIELLKKLAFEGMRLRYGPSHALAQQRVNKELEIIDKLGFNAYFLITWDIIRYARARGFYYVGRGSGANSIVAYCLQITDVDPIELDLYFERFLNPYRSSPPDFDIDFSWLDRDEVIDYVFKRYGESRVALLGMYTTFQFNAVIRQLGKVFGLPKAEIDLLGERGYYYGDGRAAHFAGKTREDNIQRLILQYGKLMNNFPDHLSIHPGGMLISEEPIHTYTATYLPPKNFVTTQIDMFGAEHIGLYKLDILSQRGLGHIKETIRLVRDNRQVQVNIGEVEKFKQDFLVRKQIKDVNTIGCFYIESPAMRQLLKKLSCDDYITLVAASSIIRPGVASSGMMREYIFRYHNGDKFEYIHPVMKELLAETYGVMVFQEDVIKVAHHFAGLDMGEADILRRAMSGKYRGNQEMMRIRDKFFVNCAERGYPDDISREVWRQIESFGGYSFSKAHSASFAVESFQDLYLKTYYPMEFMVGVINNFGGFYSTSLYFYELIKAGAGVHLPCVNKSEYLTHIYGREVYAGLVHIKELEKELGLQIVAERKRGGCFLHLQDFIERTHIAAEQLNILVSIGALRFTSKSKKQLLWEANFLQKKNKMHLPAHQSIFREEPRAFALPRLIDHPVDDMYDEMEILGFPLRNPFELVNDDPAKYTPARELDQHIGREITLLGYYVTYKVVPTKKSTVMSFGTFIDANLDWIDTVHFPDSLRQYPLQGGGFYRITGKVVEDFSACSVEVHAMYRVGYRDRKYKNL
jgi:DNA polymerase-3 subunit alpha